MKEKTQFNGNEGAFITKNTAKKEVKDYKDGNPKKKAKAYFFGKNKLEKLLNQPGAMGLRVYFSKKGGETDMIIVAADKDGNNIIPRSEENTTFSADSTEPPEDEQILNSGSMCPPDCNTDPFTGL
ncbi:hypothetical protein [Marinigracilibium pacificum]|uniref:Uncharacterized protein n=1 Tax=Marinigracilibium pacificum TaxID=2729599 RepID=A0A848J1J6_9BACT|nr:hypothetical protein [Marinigracilibium pacificum]NMM47092.1 hypothetical protein [Marinigracilibium pacificum]